MLERAIDRLDGFLERHRRPAAIAASLYFWSGIGVQANFIDLPPIPFVSELFVFWSGILIGTVYWAVVYPRLEARRKARAGQGPTAG